jgi:uncharacterized protein YecT (DUF1311 family)
MAARDKVAEIETLKRRRGAHGSRASWCIRDLSKEWNGGQGPLSNASDFIVIRLVTILEVAIRDWISNLIDHGEPFVENAASLVHASGLKFDFAITRAVHGERVTLGELVAHSISTNRLPEIERALSTVLGEDIFRAIEGTVDRWKHEVKGEPANPIISDLVAMRAALAKLFDVRHIIVHEIPNKSPYINPDIETFLRSAREFVEAVEEEIETKLRGKYPLTQTEMNNFAQKEADETDAELQQVLLLIDTEQQDRALWKAQAAWEEYRRLRAEYCSRINDPSPGSMAPIIYNVEFETITSARVKQLRLYLNREEGDF